MDGFGQTRDRAEPRHVRSFLPRIFFFALVLFGRNRDALRGVLRGVECLDDDDHVIDANSNEDEGEDEDDGRHRDLDD